MACAAFCIPTSMTMVRRTVPVSRAKRDSSELHSMLAIISSAHAMPVRRKLTIISSVYCRKKRNASVISAGKAIFPNIFPVLLALYGLIRRNRNPASNGTNRSTMFCTSSFPIGNSMEMPALCETKCDVSSIMSGSVKRVSTLLTAVSVIDRAMSPLASMEKTFEELPPGQHAMSTSPMKYTGGIPDIHAMAKAIRGNRIICPAIPVITALGFRITFTNDSLFSSVPKRNMRRIRIGITIQIVFISCFMLSCQG